MMSVERRWVFAVLLAGFITSARRVRAEGSAPSASGDAASGSATSASGDAARRDATDVVVTGTRTPERTQRATVKTDVVTRDEAERRGATNIAEALSSQPGVQVNPGAYGFLGGVSAIQIQGFDRDRVLILEDGERVVGDVGGAIDLANLPTSDVERIEIVTGPTSSLYGSSAIGGVVNIVTAPPKTEGPSARFRLEGRSYRGLVAQATGAYRRGGTWLTLDGSGTRQDGVRRTESLPDLRLPATERSLVGIRAGTTLGPNVDVRVRGRYLRDRLDGLETTTAPGLGRYVIDLPNETNRFTLHLIETLHLGRGSSLRMTLGSQWIEGRTARDYRDSPLDEVRKRHDQMQSIEGVATIADGRRTWVVGARAEAERFSQDVQKTESLSTGLSTTDRVEVVPQTLGTIAGYGQLQWKLGSFLTILPGVRAERHTRFGGAVTPRLALASILSSTLRLRASAGRGFRAPSSKELGFVFDHSAYGYRVDGNPNLSPETSWGVNGDLTWLPFARREADVDESTMLRASAFANWVDNLIDLDIAGGTSSGGIASYTYKNFGSARTMGAQLDAAYRFLDRFNAEASYAYLYTRDDVNDRPLGGRPPHVVTTSVRGRTFWQVEAYVRWRVATDAFVDETTRSPGYTTMDLRLSRPFGNAKTSSLEAYVGVLNALDVHQDPGRVGDLRPPLGRVFYVGLRGRFSSEEE